MPKADTPNDRVGTGSRRSHWLSCRCLRSGRNLLQRPRLGRPVALRAAGAAAKVEIESFRCLLVGRVRSAQKRAGNDSSFRTSAQACGQKGDGCRAIRDGLEIQDRVKIRATTRSASFRF